MYGDENRSVIRSPMSGFQRAQRHYDSMQPPDPGPDFSTPEDNLEEGQYMDEDGEVHNIPEPDFEAMAEEKADRERDRDY